MKHIREDILTFWFEETSPELWFQSGPAFDTAIKERFAHVYEAGICGEYDHWMDDAQGCLALCILLDQFPRNMFRGTPKAFAADGKALEIARYALTQNFDQSLPPVKRRFLYLPFEHSEHLDDQKKSVALFGTMKDEDSLGYDYALRHLEVIEKFGRFPHRNKILGRSNTQAEEEYLAQPGAGF